jgi:chemotaxis protein CheD
MPTTVVDIAALAVSRGRGAVLVTYSLGSCIGVSLWDPIVKVGGLLHFMLPDSNISLEKARSNPAMFCDTGVPELLRAAYELGAVPQRVVLRVAGGAQLFQEHATFEIGRRNYLALRQVLARSGLAIRAEDIGGTVSRTMKLDVGTGRLTIRAGQQEVPL